MIVCPVVPVGSVAPPDERHVPLISIHPSVREIPFAKVVVPVPVTVNPSRVSEGSVVVAMGFPEESYETISPSVPVGTVEKLTEQLLSPGAQLGSSVSPGV